MHNASATLVYGGGTVGLMGELAKTLVSLSGPSSVHGIIPRALVKYEANSDMTPEMSNEEVAGLINGKQYGRTTVVGTMHERKALMASEIDKGDVGSGFVALTGGFGTLEELMEMVTWNQLGILSRGVCLFNVKGYWDGLLAWVQGSVEAGFSTEKNARMLESGRDAEEVLTKLKAFKPSEDRLKLDWKQL